MIPLAFEDAVRCHAGRMLALARRLLGCERQACDCIREACLAAAATWPRESRSENAERALLRITARIALAHLRTAPARDENSMALLLPRFCPDGHRAPSDARHRGLAASATLLPVLDPRTEVNACIDRLPRSYREALLLCDVERFDPADAASLMGLTLADLRTTLHRARLALREMLEREELI